MIRNKSADPKAKLKFRIGVNSGAVIEDQRNPLGDGVNIASRLGSLAKPNRRTFSKIVYDFVEGKTNLKFHDLGVQKIKKNEFHAFEILLNSTQKRQIKTQTKISQMMPAATGLVVIASVLAAALSIFGFNLNQVTNNIKPTQDEPSLMTGPFQNLTNDEENEYIGLGLEVTLSSILSKNERVTNLSKETGKILQKN